MMAPGKDHPNDDGLVLPQFDSFLDKIQEEVAHIEQKDSKPMSDADSEWRRMEEFLAPTSSIHKSTDEAYNVLVELKINVSKGDNDRPILKEKGREIMLQIRSDQAC